MSTKNHHVHCVALVGIDGSGKSTQTGKLVQWLSRQNQPVYSIHPFGWKLLPFLSHVSKSKSSQGQPQAKRSVGLGRRLVAWMEVLDIGLYLWLAWARCNLSTLLRGEDTWLVSDRSFEDLLLKHQRLGTFSHQVSRVLRHWVPSADLTLWLCTEPDTARQRDGDFPATYYAELHRAYQVATSEYGWRTVSTTSRSREEIFEEIVQIAGGLGIGEVN